MDSSFQIAIIGGGPGGLTLARILQNRGYKSVTIYEREESRFTRGQGGTLDLHKNTGQYSLKLAGLTEEFNKHSRPEGEDLRILDKHGVPLFEEITNGTKNDRPEIDRSKLRDILLDSLDEGTVKWGFAFTSLRIVENKKLLLSFQNGRSAEADFVVGADGAWSKVRDYLSPAKPIFAGINFVEMTLNDPPIAITNLVGRGSMFAMDDGKGLIAQKNGHGVIKVYAAIREAADWLKIDLSEQAAAKKFLLKVFEDWNEDLLGLIESNSEDFVHRLIYALPVGHSWVRDGGNGGLTENITLIGDAAHLMSPFAGEGVNLAMIDGANLALALTSSHSAKDLKCAVLKFERTMFARASKAAKQSADNLELMFGKNGAVQLANLMKIYHSYFFIFWYILYQVKDTIANYFYSIMGWK